MVEVPGCSEALLYCASLLPLSLSVQGQKQNWTERLRGHDVGLEHPSLAGVGKRTPSRQQHHPRLFCAPCAEILWEECPSWDSRQGAAVSSLDLSHLAGCHGSLGRGLVQTGLSPLGEDTALRLFWKGS